jgi:hypothetical protein
MSTATIDLLLALALAAPPAQPGTDAADLSAARAEAETARKQAPSAVTWGREAEVCERMADYACAREARAQQRGLTAEGSAERAAVDEKLKALEDMSRGTVGDEPASTRRADNDRARQKPLVTVAPAAATDKKPAPAPKNERIIKKWYFWVTVIAIAASGAAITAIAVDAARDEQKGIQPVTSSGTLGPQGFGLRF